MRVSSILAVLLGAYLTACSTASLRSDDVQSYASIERFLDEQSIAVARLDLNRISPLALSNVVAMQADLAAAVYDAERAKLFADNLREKAGPIAFVIYAVPTSTQLSALWVVPLDQRLNSSAAERAFPASSRLEAAWDWKIVEGQLIAGPKQLVASAVSARDGRAPAVTAEGRASLAEAIGAVADAPSIVAIIPSADQRRVLREVMPDLPDSLGAGRLRGLFQSLEWAAIGFDPTKSLRVVLQTPSEAAARETRELAEALQASFASVDNGSHQWEGMARLMLPLAAALQPQTHGSQVIFELDGEQLATALDPAVAAFTGAADRRAAIHQLKQIALAMHLYHGAVKDKDGRQHFPDTASYDASGKPLLSWRVHILPFLDQDPLYQEFHLDEPWDSEHNKQLLERMPDVYRLPGSKAGAGKTSILLPIEEQTAFANGKGLNFRQIPDGTSNTILAVEVDDEHAVPWTAPYDWQVDPSDPKKNLGRHYGSGTLVVIADGSVRFLPESTSAEQLRALLSPAGSEVIELK